MLTAEAPQAPQALQRPFAAIIVAWDGIAASDHHDVVTSVTRLAEELLRQQVWLVALTDDDFDNINHQFCSLVSPQARQHVLICTNHGSEVYGFDASGASEQRFRRVATPREDEILTIVAEHVRDTIRAKTGLDIGIVYDRLNRREVDLIPDAEWAYLPKSSIGEITMAVDARLRNAGLSGGIAQALRLAERSARDSGLRAHIMSNSRRITVSLTDKGDAGEWVKRRLLHPNGIAPTDVLIAGSEFGAIAGYAGSDERLRYSLDGAVAVSFGTETGGVPPGVLHLGGGPGRLGAILLDQICLRYENAHPSPPALSQHEWARNVIIPPADPLWRLDAVGYNPALEHGIESRFATANGALGVRGALAQPTTASHPATFVAGLFDNYEYQPGAPPIPALVPLPDPTSFQLLIEGKPLDLAQGTIQSLHRWLDMRRGVLGMEWHHCDPEGNSVRLQLARFTPLRQRTLHAQVALIASAQPASMRLATQFEPAPEKMRLIQKMPQKTVWETKHSAQRLEHTSASTHDVAGEIPPTALGEETKSGQHWTWHARAGQPATFIQVSSIARQQQDDSAGRAVAAVEQARAQGLAHLLADHERAWAERWAESDIEIEGDDEAQRALRFALYHLISAANPEDEHVSIGARGLTGEAYLGHVFWDTEIFMLPFYTFTWPEAARALLMYRYHTLPAARAKAARLGYRGALYAWESADTGDETTPPYVRMLDGRIQPIRCGISEQHISADIAYAVWQYWQATGDTQFLLNAGAEIILETARFWSSRATLEDDGHYHIRRVIGPDEYHGEVDDNAFTNEMARWNIERGLEVATILGTRWSKRWSVLRRRLAVTPDELAQWREVVDKLRVHFDPTTQLIEQFAGFSELEPVDIASLPRHDVPLDMLLGPERTAKLQVLKQADVVMLLALLWNRYPPAQREANFRYYEPRCAHGSSLSPATHAVVAARLGDTELADRFLHQAAAIDLDDTMGNAALGVHMAALGGLWQAAALGLTGLSLIPDGFRFDPHLPESWSALRVPLQWHGSLVRVAIQQFPLRLTATLERGQPLTLEIADLRARLQSGQSWRCRWNEDTQVWEEEASERDTAATTVAS